MSDTATTQIEEERIETGRWRFMVRVLLPAWLIGGFFVFSAAAKLASLGAFERYLIEQNLVPSLTVAAWMARLVIMIEIFVGLGFFQRAWLRSFFLPVCMIMLFGFSIYLAYAGYYKGQLSNCHCLGELLPMSPKASLAKNILLLIGAAWLWRETRVSQTATKSLVPVIMALSALLIVFAGFPIRSETGLLPPAADKGTAPPSRFSRFTDFEPVGSVDLTRGTRIVVFVSLTCDHCQKLTGELAATPGLPDVYLIALGEPHEWDEFALVSQSDFPRLLIEPELFFDYIGAKPPRVFLLQDGQPIGRWDEGEFSIEALRQAIPK